MFDTTATLYKETITKDEYLNEIKTYSGKEVFLRRTRSIYRDEFYQAAAQGMKPAAVLVVFFGDYDGEKVVKWGNTYYTITRAYQRPNSDDLELTIEETIELKDGIGGGGYSS